MGHKGRGMSFGALERGHGMEGTKGGAWHVMGIKGGHGMGDIRGGYGMRGIRGAWPG